MASRPDPSRQRPSSLAFAGKSSLPDGPTSGRMRSPEEARAVSSGAEEINGPKNRGLASNGGLRSFASSDRPPSRAGDPVTPVKSWLSSSPITEPRRAAGRSDEVTELMEKCANLEDSLAAAEGAARADKVRIASLTAALANAQASATGSVQSKTPLMKSGASLRGLLSSPSPTHKAAVGMRVDGVSVTPTGLAEFTALQEAPEKALAGERAAKEATKSAEQAHVIAMKEQRKAVADLQSRLDKAMADLGSARAAESAALSALKHSESAAARALTEATAQTERKHAEVMSALQSMTIESTAKEARIKELEAQLASMSSQLKAAGEQTAKSSTECPQCCILQGDLNLAMVAERNLRRSMREVEVKLGEEVKRSDELKAQLQAAIAEGKRERDARHAAVADTVHTLRQQVATLTAELAAKAESDLDEVLGDLTAHRSHRTHILQGGSLGDDDLELVYSDSETAGLTNRSP